MPKVRGGLEAGVKPLRADDSAAADRSGATPTISGTGYLIWLPDGRLSGHLISSGAPLGVMGLEVLSERECTRDAEWKLLHLTLLNLTHKAEVSCLAEKIGEDSTRLKAPFDLHGSEEGTIGGSSPPIDDSLQLEFACDTILAESAAEQHLGRFSPSLRGRGAIVNVGPFTCRGLALAKLLAAPHTEQLLYDEDLDG
ncbi:g6004 [Coccomyxa elongata]